MRYFRQYHLQDRAIFERLLALEPAKECSERREGARQRARYHAVFAPFREKGARRCGVEARKITKPRCVTGLRVEKTQELPQVARIGFARCGALSALGGEMPEPGFDGLLKIEAERQL